MTRALLIASLFVLAGCPETVPPPTDGGVDAGDPTQIVVRFDPDAIGFYRMPWPSDSRLTPEGTPEMSDFPGGRPVLKAITEIEASVHGFATMPVVYVALTSPVTDASLPQGLEALEATSAIQLVDLSTDECGARVPLEIAFAPVGDSMRDDNMLQIANAVGTVLTPGHPYGLVILRSFGAPESRSTPRPEAFDRALNDTAGTDALSRSLDPLRRCLPSTGVNLEDVAVATVFTPQDPVAEMQRLRDFAMDPAELETRAVEQWQVSEAYSRRRLALQTFRGYVQMPVFQEGTTPYRNDGGALVFDANGDPVVQRFERTEIAIAMRTYETPPPGPRPILVFMDGTGWEPWGHIADNWIWEALDAGFVVMSFMPQFHGGRAGVVADTEVLTFNVLNPSAVRANFRQQSVETSYFIRLIREQIDGLAGLPDLDTDRIVYGGHSQGALAGAITAAVEDQFLAYVFNGLSSFLTFTVLYRDDILNFASAVSVVFQYSGDLDRWSPLLQMMQLGGEVVDPHNYVRRWHGWPEHPEGNHVFVSNGLMDVTTTPRGIEHMTMAADMPPIAPPGWEVDPVGVWDGMPVSLPAQGNEMSISGDPVTIATYLDPTQGHGTIYRVSLPREMAVNFWDSALAGIPRLSSDLEHQCDDGADEDIDGTTDCDDPDCAATPPCVEGACDNGMDEDGNGQTDCDDPVCATNAACREASCTDGDDDGDGLADCADPDCARSAPCAEGDCADGVDGDGDTMTDCADSECTASESCRERSCTNMADDDRDGDVDCADSQCLGSPACPETMCTGGNDENGNGLVDCADPSCTTMSCPRAAETLCTNGGDDDGDSAADCEDADCARVASCVTGTCADAVLGSQTGARLYAGTLEREPNDYPPGDCVGLGAGADTQDLSFLWTAPADGEFVISTQGSAVDTVLHVLDATCDPLSELACNDDNGPVASSEVIVTATAGAQFVIVVSAYDVNEDGGEFMLHIYPRP